MKKLKLHNVITIVLCVFTAQMKAASGPVSVLPQSVPQQFLPQAYSQAQPNQNAIDVNQLIQLDNQINLQVASKIAFLTALNISAAGVFTPEQFAQALNQTPAEEFNYFMTLFNAIAQELKRADLFTNEMHMRFNKRPFLIEEVANFQKLLAQTIISKFRLDQKMMLNAHLQSLLNKIEAIQRAHAHKYQEEQKQQAAEVQKTTTTQLKLNPNEAGKNMLNINPPAQPRAPLTQMQTGNNQQPKSAANCAAPSQPVAEQRKKQEVQSQMHPALAARQGTVTQKGVAITHTRLPSNWEPYRIPDQQTQTQEQAYGLFNQLLSMNDLLLRFDQITLTEAQNLIQDFKNKAQNFKKIVADNQSVAQITPTIGGKVSNYNLKLWADREFPRNIQRLEQLLQNKIAEQKRQEENSTLVASFPQTAEGKKATEQFKELFALYYDIIPGNLRALEDKVKAGAGKEILQKHYQEIAQQIEMYAQKIALFKKFLAENPNLAGFVVPPAATSLGAWAEDDGGFDHGLQEYKSQLLEFNLMDGEKIQKTISGLFAKISEYIPYFVSEQQYMAQIKITPEEIASKRTVQEKQDVEQYTNIGSVAYKIANAFNHIKAQIMMLNKIGDHARARDMSKAALDEFKTFELFFNPSNKVYHFVKNILDKSDPQNMITLQAHLDGAKKYFIEASK